jgi:hypothetical protein
MRRIILALGIIAGTVLLSIPTANACGDKSLRIGGGARYKRTTRPATILIYIPSNASAKAVANVPKIRDFLIKWKHKARTVQGLDSFNEALRAGQYDLVLSNLTEAADLQKEIESSSSKPVVIPLVFKVTKPEMAAARTQYRYMVRNPNDGLDYLEAIEEAMKSRARTLQTKA